MPTTIEDLEAAVEETISQAHSILFLNHNILKEYEDRQRKVIFCNLCLPFFPLHHTSFFDLSVVTYTCNYVID
jgi:hypothetical protein